MWNACVKFFTTVGYVGYFPVAPGTAGSLVGIVLLYLIPMSLPVYLIVLAVVIVLGFVMCGVMEKQLGKSDPSCIVIDEVAGVMIAYCFLPRTLLVAVLAFVLFRFFDITKIYPINKLEKIPLGYGVMADDLLAGVYSNIVLQIIVKLWF